MRHFQWARLATKKNVCSQFRRKYFGIPAWEAEAWNYMLDVFQHEKSPFMQEDKVAVPQANSALPLERKPTPIP
jgi:hypothetical protein